VLNFHIYCKVVDNLGDAGVTWRLARQLALEHRVAVRLVIDAPDTLALIAPAARAGEMLDGVLIERWETALPPRDAGTVVVSAFGCELPSATRAAIASLTGILWINLEYLSAESWIDDCHSLASRKPSDGAVEYFFYPGFSQASGGLLRESGLIADREAFIAAGATRWLREHGLGAVSGERRISLFCYPDAPLAEWLSLLSESPEPTRILVAQGVATEALLRFSGTRLEPGDCIVRGSLSLECYALLAQQEFDRLLWSCDLNFVRGEDSWVRAIWAGRPFIWQPYRQANLTHRAKLEAFLGRLAGTAERPDHGDHQSCDPEPEQAAQAAMAMMRAWDGDGRLEECWPAYEASLPAISRLHRRLTGELCQQPDLCSQLLAFCRDKLLVLPGESG
jgi:uncharacterized repeat protein (TIGR03837 family)